MRRVIVESPYSHANPSCVVENLEYARRAIRDSILRGEAPIASHLLFTQPGILTEAERRQMGIDAGLAWYEVADLIVFYTDRGWSQGMYRAHARALNLGIAWELRSISS